MLKYDTTTKLLTKIQAKYKQFCMSGNVIHGQALLPLAALPDSKLQSLNNIGTPTNCTPPPPPKKNLGHFVE
jgi:hypothetical protein